MKDRNYVREEELKLIRRDLVELRDLVDLSAFLDLTKFIGLSEHQSDVLVGRLIK